ncbi:MAG: type II toxin-antitoxin system PemK/MazF family toxin [Desulfovibrionaceae bacterium]|nr:type II toxin-antitoxin system PemK/MazF family toxin [Desulfovibrionaceae bacterium]
MAIKFQPEIGSILLCDFEGQIPEMTKKRPVIILASVSPRLCLVAPLSTTDPEEQQPWHCLINTPITLPAPYDSKVHWLKGDMVAAVGFQRLSMPSKGKDRFGNRLYVKLRLSVSEMHQVRRCVAAAIGISPLDFQSE